MCYFFAVGDFTESANSLNLAKHPQPLLVENKDFSLALTNSTSRISLGSDKFSMAPNESFIAKIIL